MRCKLSHKNDLASLKTCSGGVEKGGAGHWFCLVLHPRSKLNRLSVSGEIETPNVK